MSVFMSSANLILNASSLAYMSHERHCVTVHNLNEVCSSISEEINKICKAEPEENLSEFLRQFTFIRLYGLSC